MFTSRRQHEQADWCFAFESDACGGCGVGQPSRGAVTGAVGLPSPGGVGQRYRDDRGSFFFEDEKLGVSQGHYFILGPLPTKLEHRTLGLHSSLFGASTETRFNYTQPP